MILINNISNNIINKMFLPKTNEELIKISDKKPIYIIKNRPNILVKIISVTNLEKIDNEIYLQKQAAKLGVAPKIIDHYYLDHKMFILMEKIDGMDLANMYGENKEDIPKKIWDEIRNILEKLYFAGIQYIDITPYNFMIDKNHKIKIIDFGHASQIKVNWFLRDFLDGLNEFNPDFK